MTGLNHALVGGLIGKFVPWPVAIPLAFVSHFVLDTLPHYGIPPKTRDTSKFWKIFFTIDFLITFALLFWVIKYHHYAMMACGWAAVIPDFVWVARVVRTRSFDFSATKSRYEKWHIKIQRYEFPRGIWIEVPLAILLFYSVIIKTT